MKRLLIVVGALTALIAIAPSVAQARECGLPRREPLWIDFADGSVPYWPMFARPGIVGAAANFIYPAQLRERGAKTVYWEMNLKQRVGTPTNPMDPALVGDWADRVFYRAIASSGCATPWIALNELWGANLPAPWSPTNTQYRENVLTFVRRLSALGAHPFLLVNSKAFTDGEAGDWWREVARYSDFVRELYFSAPQIHRQGPVLGSRTLRNAFRRGVTELTAIGIRPSKIGIFLGFHTNPGQGGREGLKPASAWFNHIKLQVLAVKQVRREIPFATVWSWGWGEWSASDRDPDKPAAACVYLWTRNHRLCGGPAYAGPGFDPSLAVGQLNLPAGAQCKTPWGTIGSGQVSSLAGVTGDRNIAYTSLFARLVLKSQVELKREELRAAVRSIVTYRFGGSSAAYRQALARAGATRKIGEAVVADELRQAKVQRRFGVIARPTGREIAEYQQTYSETSARLVQAKPAQSWLGGKTRGVAIDGMAPAAVFRIRPGKTVTLITREGAVKVRAFGIPVPLGAFPLQIVRSSIRAALTKVERNRVFDTWLMHREAGALSLTTCRHDVLPAVGTLELTSELPFLELTS